MAKSAESYRPFRLEVNGTLELQTFHVGTGSDISLVSDSPILRGVDGRPYVPAASLRGVLRSHLEREVGFCGGNVDLLFGDAPASRDSEALSRLGRLFLEDCVSSEFSVYSEVRDQVRIEPKWGAAADGGKFDLEVAGQTHLSFQLIYEGESKNDAELCLVEEAIRALEDGDLTCGGKSGIGHGRLCLVKTQYLWFNRKDPAELARWLDHRLTGKATSVASFPWPPTTPSTTVNKLKPLSIVEFRLELQTEGPVLVRAPIPPMPAAGQYDPKDRNSFAEKGRFTADQVFITTGPQGRPYLPGSSLRGVLRHQAERIVKTLKSPPEPFVQLFGETKSESGRKGCLELSDGKLIGQPRRVYLDHVAIDRITGFAADAKKFSTCGLQSPKFSVTIRVRFTQEELAALALVGFLLRDLMQGWLWCGGGVTRGYGYVKTASIRGMTLDLLDSFAANMALPGWERAPRAGRIRITTGEVSFPDLNPLWEHAENAWNAQLPKPEQT